MDLNISQPGPFERPGGADDVAHSHPSSLSFHRLAELPHVPAHAFKVPSMYPRARCMQATRAHSGQKSSQRNVIKKKCSKFSGL
jgi:hypothetical protein